MDALVRSLLDAVPPHTDSLTAWWSATAAIRARWPTPVDRAFACGAHADRLGFAFAGGYQEALRTLVGKSDGLISLCVTEDRGNTPRAIETVLAEVAPGRYEVTGKKKWATGGPLASWLLVVATTGPGPDGKPRLRVTRIATSAPGVDITPASTPFVPEIPHAEITLAKVAVTEADLLPGDGYTEYVKPFRTIEDAHVHAALVGYLAGVARRHRLPHELVEQLLALVPAVRAAALADPKSPVTHVVLAGALALVHAVVDEIERRWSPTGDDEWLRWQRDRALLGVAGSARAARRDKAWSLLGA